MGNRLGVLSISLFALLFSIPILIILLSLFNEYSENWFHIYNTVLNEYVLNSFTLFIGVSIGVFILGVPTAWIVATSDFKFKKIISCALVLPFAVPPYIMAYSFTGLFDSYGTANELIRSAFDTADNYVFFPSIRNIGGAIIVFSLTLYPYIYLISYNAFLNQSRDIFDVSRTLGLSKIKTFFKIGIPITRPAIVAGLMIVAMETLSDFGAVEHFAIPTFTTGIFRAWFGLYDLTTAKQLAANLFIIFLVLIAIEKFSRRKINYINNSISNKNLTVTKLKGKWESIAIAICLIPIIFGFLIPCSQLLYWTINYKLSFFDENLLYTIFNSVYLALISGLFCIVIGTLINYLLRINKSKFLSLLNNIITSGYGIPGIVLSVGILNFFLFLDESLNVFLIGTVLGLIFAYSIKFYALPNSSIQSGLKKISVNLDDVTKTMGYNKIKLLLKVHVPLLRNSYLTGILIFMIDVIKELPMTLILRPFNFNTLSVSAYTYAADERMVEAAAPSIAIIMVCLIPIFFVFKSIKETTDE